MKPSNETMLAFYQQLGRVFYGVAAADKDIRLEEVERLDEIVKKFWLLQEDTFDEFDVDAAYQIEIVFSWLNNNDWDKENLLEDFKDFTEEHPKLFGFRNKRLINGTAASIADSFHGTNKAESKYIENLKDILK